MQLGSIEWYAEVSNTIAAIYREELNREADFGGWANWLFHAREEGRDAEWIRARIRESEEWHAIHDPKPESEHIDPRSYSAEQLLKIRGSLNIKINVPQNIRPNQDSNVASTNALWNYLPSDQDKIIQGYKDRGYTHGPIGPFIDIGYHGLVPPIDFRRDEDMKRVQAAITKLWDAGLILPTFIQIDGWSLDDMRSLEPIFRSDWWQKYCPIVVNGWEQQGSKYGWSNAEYVQWLSWLRDVFPNSIRLLHTIADIEAPVGNGDDTSKIGMSNGECWGRVTPLIHGWLNQGNALFTANHIDPTGDGRTDAEHWLDQWNRNNKYSFVNRFQNGHAGWPMTSANGGPMKVYAGEYWSFDMYWENTDEEIGREYGKKAVDLGADGAFDGWKP